MQSVTVHYESLEADNIQRKATRAVRPGKVGAIRLVLVSPPGQVISRSLLAFHEEPQQARFCLSR